MQRPDDGFGQNTIAELDEDIKTSGGLPQEDVDDRPDVSSVIPEDYPLDQRAKGDAKELPYKGGPGEETK
jgi:hypothetical protein